MKSILRLTYAVILLVACKKGSGDNIQNTTLSAITICNPLAHTLNIQQFQFSNGLLVTYSDKTIDTFKTEVDWESRTYTFTYEGEKNLPDGVTFLDTTREVASVNEEIEESFGLIYDNKDRLMLDSGVAAYSGEPTPKWFCGYSGDSVIFSFSPATNPAGTPNPNGFLLLSSGNIAANGSSFTYTYSSLANPLKNSSIARTFAPYFYSGLIGIYMQSYALPVDFISTNLPSGYVDGNGNSTTFSWTRDSKGRVSGGTAANMFPSDNSINGPVTITFTYR